MTDWQDDALAHAQKVFPAEACGLVYAVGDDSFYFPCSNLSGHADHFKIGARDFVACEEKGPVVAVFHSHPYARAKPSAADLSSCESSGLPWHILSLPNVEWAYCAPSGFRAPLLGRVFAHGVHDCWSVVRDGLMEYAGIQVIEDSALVKMVQADRPGFERDDDWWLKKPGVEAPNLYADNFEKAGFRRVYDEPQVHDVFVMHIKADVPNHVGLHLGDGLMLHHLMGQLSARVVWAGSYYQKVTTMIVRHESLCAR